MSLSAAAACSAAAALVMVVGYRLPTSGWLHALAPVVVVEVVFRAELEEGSGTVSISYPPSLPFVSDNAGLHFGSPIELAWVSASHTCPTCNHSFTHRTLLPLPNLLHPYGRSFNSNFEKKLSLRKKIISHHLYSGVLRRICDQFPMWSVVGPA